MLKKIAMLLVGLSLLITPFPALACITQDGCDGTLYGDDERGKQQEISGWTILELGVKIPDYLKWEQNESGAWTSSKYGNLSILNLWGGVDYGPIGLKTGYLKIEEDVTMFSGTVFYIHSENFRIGPGYRDYSFEDESENYTTLLTEAEAKFDLTDNTSMYLMGIYEFDPEQTILGVKLWWDRTFPRIHPFAELAGENAFRGERGYWDLRLDLGVYLFGQLRVGIRGKLSKWQAEDDNGESIDGPSKSISAIAGFDF